MCGVYKVARFLHSKKEDNYLEDLTMEIKDVNKLTNMFFNQSSSASSVEGALQNLASPQKNSSIKDEFMAMLQQTSGGISFSSINEDEKNSVASVSSTPISRTSKKIVSDKSDTDWSTDKNITADKSDKTTSSDKAATDKDTSSSTATKDDSSKDSAASADKADASSQDNSSASQETSESPSKEASQGDSSSNASNTNTEAKDSTASGEVSNDGTLADEGDISDSISSEVIDELLGMLASLGVNVADLNSLNGELTIVNAATNESMTINAADLLTALNNQSEIMVPLVNTDNQVDADIVLMPLSEVRASLQDTGVDISSLEPVLNKLSNSLKPQTDLEQTSDIIADADIDVSLQNVQGEALSKKISSDKKVEVSVKVQEENFSYKKAEDSISTPLNSIVSDKSTSQEAQPQTTLTPTANSAAQLQGGMAANTQVMTGTVNTVAADKVADAQLSGIKDIANGSNSNTLQHAGSEAAQLAKTEQTLASETKNSTIRDVYKGMSKDAIEQIKVNITKSAVKGVDKIEIQLKPEDLGHIEIKMQISKDGKLQAHIISSRAETMDMLQKDMSSLEKAFNDAGFNTDEGSFSFSFREKNNEQNNQEALRNFLGEILEQDTANSDILTDMASGEHWDGKSALNIRV